MDEVDDGSDRRDDAGRPARRPQGPSRLSRSGAKRRAGLPTLACRPPSVFQVEVTNREL